MIIIDNLNNLLQKDTERYVSNLIINTMKVYKNSKCYLNVDDSEKEVNKSIDLINKKIRSSTFNTILEGVHDLFKNNKVS